VTAQRATTKTFLMFCQTNILISHCCFPKVPHNDDSENVPEAAKLWNIATSVFKFRYDANVTLIFLIEIPLPLDYHKFCEFNRRARNFFVFFGENG
jgi:hypothetical protein